MSPKFDEALKFVFKSHNSDDHWT